MCHWSSANVGGYLRDWKNQGICNRQISLSSRTHSFNQPRSAVDKCRCLTRICGSQHLIRWCCSFGHAKQNLTQISQTLLTSPIWRCEQSHHRQRQCTNKAAEVWYQESPQLESGQTPQSQDSADLWLLPGSLRSSNLGPAFLMAGVVLAAVSSKKSQCLMGKSSLSKLVLHAGAHTDFFPSEC